jgi:hypothetical protein
MIKMNYYVHNNSTMSTADLLRGASHQIVKLSDSMDKPNEILAMLNDVLDLVTRDKIADKIESIAASLFQCAGELRGPVIDQRPMPK